MVNQGQTGKELSRVSGKSESDFVLEKVIFSNVFEKDIQRVYLYKKAERLAKAVQLIAPAFTSSPALKSRFEAIAIGLIDAALTTGASRREVLSRELLALLSILALARSANLLSPMNADLISREGRLLLEETAAYEEPRLSFDEAASLSSIARQTPRESVYRHDTPKRPPANISKGHLSDTKNMGRREAILGVVRTKGPVYIKDISLVVRDVSEKTVQRELQALVKEGIVSKQGERRWTLYSMA